MDLLQQIIEIRDSGGVSGKIHPKLKEGLDRGINPLKCPGVDRLDRRFLRELARHRAAEARDRLHNDSVAVSRGKVSSYETPFVSDAGVYVLGRVKKALEHVHDSTEKPGVVFQEALDLRAGSTLQEAIVQAAHVKRGL